MSIEAIELFDIFSETFGKEKAQAAVRDIETLISDHKRELATKEDIQKIDTRLSETELKLTKEIREVELKLTKEIREVELKLTREIELNRREIEAVKLEIEKAKSSTVKWVVGWVAGLLIAYTGAIFTLLMLVKK
ncbi:MAG: hypothetical protein AB1611_14725 [bacterium]